MGIQINGQTDTITAIDGALTVSGADLPTVTNLNATGIVTATGFVGNITGNINATGVSTIATLNVTQSNPTNLNVSGVTTTATLRATSIVGVTTAGITTAYISSVNDGPLSGARNRIINGDMKIFQRGSATTIGASSVYALDRWLFGREAGTESARFTVTSESLTSSDTPFTSDGLRKTMKVDITTASGGISAAQSHYIMQRIEGFNVSDLVYGTSSAKTCTVSFWLKTDVKTGQMGVALYNGGNRYYVQNINATTSWTKYTLVFPGDTSGSIADDNTQQLTLIFTLSSGSNLQGGANSWTGNFRNSTSGQVDFTDSTSNNIYLTGVQLEVGTVATPFERRSYGQELALCQRYYQNYGTVVFHCWGHRVADTDGIRSQVFTYSSPMRVAPTMSYDDGAGNSTRVALESPARDASTNVAFSFQQKSWGWDNSFKYPYGATGFSNGVSGTLNVYNLTLSSEL